MADAGMRLQAARWLGALLSTLWGLLQAAPIIWGHLPAPVRARLLRWTAERLWQVAGWLKEAAILCERWANELSVADFQMPSNARTADGADTESIARALAASPEPLYHCSSGTRCALCGSTETIGGVEHQPICSWRLAREWMEAHSSASV